MGRYWGKEGHKDRNTKKKEEKSAKEEKNKTK